MRVFTMVAILVGCLVLWGCESSDGDDGGSDTAGAADTGGGGDATGGGDVAGGDDTAGAADTGGGEQQGGDCDSILCEGFTGEPGEIQCNAYQCQACDLEGYVTGLCQLSDAECAACYETLLTCAFGMDCTQDAAGVQDQWENGCKVEVKTACDVDM